MRLIAFILTSLASLDHGRGTRATGRQASQLQSSGEAGATSAAKALSELLLGFDVGAGWQVADTALVSGRVPRLVKAQLQRASPRLVTKSSSIGAERIDIDWGRGKSVALMVPSVEKNLDAAMESVLAEVRGGQTDLSNLKGMLGAGHVIGPSAEAMAKMLAHCPSFVSGKKVLELGCGLGTVGLTVAKSGAESVLLTDSDESALLYAKQAAVENDVTEIVSTHEFDWTNIKGWGKEATLPGSGYNLVIATDVLNSIGNALDLGKLIPRLMRERPGARALLAEPKDGKHFQVFEEQCNEGGVDVSSMPIPGHEDTVLLTLEFAYA